MKQMAKIFLLAVAVLCLQHGNAAAVSGEPSVLLRFSDATRFYRVPSADLLSACMMETMNTSGKFALQSPAPVDAGQETVAEAGETARDGAIPSPETLRGIGAGHGARFAVYGRILGLETTHAVYRDLGHAAAAVGQIADIFAGSVVGAVFGAFGGAGTAKDTLRVAAHVYVLDLSDGRIVWDKEFSAEETIPGGDPNADTVTAAGGLTANKTLVKAMDAVAGQAVKALIEDVGMNRLLIK